MYNAIFTSSEALASVYFGHSSNICAGLLSALNSTFNLNFCVLAQRSRTVDHSGTFLASNDFRATESSSRLLVG